MAFATAYERPTPSARTSTGNISALIRPPIEVYRLTMVSAQTISTPAISGLSTLRSAVMIGTVAIAARAPNQIIEVLRPMRSDSAPNIGCRHM